MDEIPEKDERTEGAPEQEGGPATDQESPSVSAREASEVAEEETEDDPVSIEDQVPTPQQEEAPPPGEGGMPEDEDVLPSEQAQESSVTGFEDGTEQQREAIVAEMAEQAAEATDQDAAPPAEEAAVETVEEPEESIAEGPVHAEPPTEPPTEAALSEVEEEQAVDLTEDVATPPGVQPEAEEETPEPADTSEPAGSEPASSEEPAGDAFTGPGDWYVIHTYAGYENKVKTNLESRIQTMQMQDKIFSVYIPMEDVMEIKGGRKQVVQKKVFPGYLLVRMEYDDDSWYVVRNTPGVTGFVAAGTGQKPTPLPRHEVEKFLAPQKEEAKPQFRLEFEEGDVVRIIAGPFADFNGTISEINVDQSKVKVMVNIFDRETPVELSFDQVARV